MDLGGGEAALHLLLRPRVAAAVAVVIRVAIVAAVAATAMTTLKGAGAAAADSDNNGTIDLSDVLVNLKHIIGLTPIDTFDVVTSHGFITDKMNTDSNGEVSLVINGDADQSHADWDFIA